MSQPRLTREDFIVDRMYTMNFLDNSNEGLEIQTRLTLKHGIWWILRNVSREDNKIKYNFGPMDGNIFRFTTQTPEASFV